MGSAVDPAEALIDELRRVPPSQRSMPQYEQRFDALFERLFEAGGLQGLGDLRTLDHVAELLRANDVEQTYPSAVEALEAHRARVADAHRKLAAILDPSVQMGDLLYSVLDSWEGLADRGGVRFSEQEEEQLAFFRGGPGTPCDRSEHFAQTYLTAVQREDPSLAELLRSLLEPALGTLRRSEQRGAAYALFAELGGAAGQFHRLNVSAAPGVGEEYADNTIDEAMKVAARRAVAAAFTLAKVPRERWNVHWTVDEPTTYEGGSIGLAVALGTLAQLQGVCIDPYTASTGAVEFDGTVSPVQHIKAKVEAARRGGFRQVLVPQGNLNEACAALAGAEVPRIVGVASVQEAWAVLEARPPMERSAWTSSASAQARRLELECINAGLKVHEKVERPGQLQLKITDHRAEGSITIYDSKKGLSFVVGGPPNTRLHATLRRFVEPLAKPETTAPVEPELAKWRVPSPADRAKVEETLRILGGFTERQEANCLLRLDFEAGGERVIARQYTSGTLTLQQAGGSRQDAPLFSDIRSRVQVVLGQPFDSPQGLTHALETGGGSHPSAEEDAKTDPASVFTTSWIGTDEAGKGDYFGPLVCAAVYVDDELSRRLTALGVRDSKTLSDARVRQLAEAIRQTCGTRVISVVPIPPDAYNRLYEQFRREGKTLNTLLAWGHARAIENLLSKGIETDNVLVDQFTDVRYITSALLKQGRSRDLNLVALPRAESNIAVAAASILARDRFLGGWVTGGRVHKMLWFSHQVKALPVVRWRTRDPPS